MVPGGIRRDGREGRGAAGDDCVVRSRCLGRGKEGKGGARTVSRSVRGAGADTRVPTDGRADAGWQWAIAGGRTALVASTEEARREARVERRDKALDEQRS